MSTFIQQLANGVSLGSIYALIALGYTMVFGVLKLINFAHSDVMMVGAYVAFFVATGLNAGPDPSIASALITFLAAMAGAAALGIAIERLVYRPLRSASRLSLLIAAMGMSLLLEYGGQVVFGPQHRRVPDVITDERIVLGDLNLTVHKLIILGVSVVLMLGLHFFVNKTRTGTAMRAVSQNVDAAKLMGVNTDFIIGLTFAIGSALAGAAGLLVAFHQQGDIDPLMGVYPGLKAFVAAVLGGIGSIYGAMLGGLLIGVAETFVAAYLPSSFRDTITFSILILVLLVRPAGLLGKFKPEKV
ncbi:MAG: branched-chain amino acid ABC transporter permease [Deltaproteobacteria bacterium]|nr:branched-chain amino acid ABC transporter permease [Deltaproteobacteria bacterium]